ncbi:MAG: hypothetical protein K2M05_04020 [Paramuribaculum sp.]|nr:hypothetical protein [Paramuribaculum sp.]MDE6304538.1 hypothetical protein [Paramuribaculum sp.]
MKHLVAILVTLFICANIHAQTAGLPHDIIRWEEGTRPVYGRATDCSKLHDIISLTGTRRSGNWKKDFSRMLKFNLISTLVFRSPRLTDFDLRNCGVHLFTEPGIILSTPQFRFLRPKVFNWELKCGFNLQFNKILLFFGYELSNYDLYAGMKQNRFRHAINDSRLSHSIFIGTALKF